MSEEPVAAEEAASQAGTQVPAAMSPSSGSTAVGEAEPVGAEPAGEAAGEAESGEDRPVSVWDDPRLPWSGKPSRSDILCWGGIVASGLYALALLPFRASLVGTYPLLGIFLSGATESIVSASAFARVGHGSLVFVVLVAIPGLMKFDLLYWWAGRLWGEKVILLLSGQRKAGVKAITRVRKWGWRFTWPTVVLAPFLPLGVIFYVAAGWEGMSVVTFLLLDLFSTLVWTGMMAGLGYSLGQRAVNVALEISHYGLWVTIGLVVLVVASQLKGVRMHR